MKTDELVRSLSRDLTPVKLHAVSRRIAIGLGLGAAATMSLVMFVLGVRPDLAIAIDGFAFWMKWLYTASLACVGIIATVHLARPDAPHQKVFLPLIIPFFLLAAIAISELLHAPREQWLGIWLGRSWTMCSALVVLFSIPIFVGLLWSFKRMAPTSLREAGAAAGLASGACAATLYGLHCPEVSATFVLTWYTLGIGSATAIGALLGPRLLRW